MANKKMRREGREGREDAAKNRLGWEWMKGEICKALKWVMREWLDITELLMKYLFCIMMIFRITSGLF